MSELFDKEVNAQKESLKKTFGVHGSEAPACPRLKKCDEDERNKQRNKKKRCARIIMFLMEGGRL